MKKFVFFLLTLYPYLSILSQNPIGLERIINEIDWKNCTESDVILAFKDNIVKRDKESTWGGVEVSSFILKNVQIGKDVADANIIVNKYNRKLLKIGGIIIGEKIDWSKGVDVISQALEEFFSSFWGKEHKKSITYKTDIEDKSTVYTDVKCEWGDTYNNDKTSKGTFFIVHKVKTIVIAIESK